MLLVVPATVDGGFGAVLVLLTAFTVAIARTLRRGSTTPCRCFGASHLVRNTTLWVVAARGLTAASQTAEPLGLAMAALAAVVLTAVVLNFDSLPYLIKE